jgi:putative colanic acid biosynthesis acetyltransferase WcaF
MNTSNLSKFSNAWYNPGASILKQAFWYCVSAVIFKTYLFPFSELKTWLLGVFGARIGWNVNIKPSVNIKYPWRLSVGNNTWIGEKVWIDNLDEVVIGSNVCVSQGALLLCGNHNYKKETFDLVTGKITLEDGVWVGAMSIVCPGVTCKSHAVLTAGSVAAHDLEPYGIYRGNPAVLARQRIIET